MEESMNAWDKLEDFLEGRWDAPDDWTVISRFDVNLDITLGDLRQILREGHPDL